MRTNEESTIAYLTWLDSALDCVQHGTVNDRFQRYSIDRSSLAAIEDLIE
jgi:hypothetical protein